MYAMLLCGRCCCWSLKYYTAQSNPCIFFIWKRCGKPTCLSIEKSDRAPCPAHWNCFADLTGSIVYVHEHAQGRVCWYQIKAEISRSSRSCSSSYRQSVSNNPVRWQVRTNRRKTKPSHARTHTSSPLLYIDSVIVQPTTTSNQIQSLLFWLSHPHIWIDL